MDRLRALRIALVVVGLMFITVALPILVWPSGWRWQPHHPYYEEMIVGIYATLGVFLILAARDPLANRSLIWFTVWSSVVHGGIMTVQALSSDVHHGHLVGDVPALFAVALVLALLTPRRGRAARA